MLIYQSKCFIYLNTTHHFSSVDGLLDDLFVNSVLIRPYFLGVKGALGKLEKTCCENNNSIRNSILF